MVERLVDRAHGKQARANPLKLLGKGSHNVTYYQGDVRRDRFVHITSESLVQQILKDRKLRRDAKKYAPGVQGVFAVSVLWGQAVPGVLPKAKQFEKHGLSPNLVGIVFDTDSVPMYGTCEEVIWQSDVTLKNPSVLPDRAALSILKRTPYKIGCDDHVVYHPREVKKVMDHLTKAKAAARVARRSVQASSTRVAARVVFAKALESKVFGPFRFKIDRPKGFVKEWPREDGSVKRYKYPVDYGYFVGHTGEDDEGLDAFVGDDPSGKIESFMKMMRNEEGKLVEDETKFLIGLTKSEREKVMGLYDPDEIRDLREYKDFYELVEVLRKFKDKKKASRTASSPASRIVSRFLAERA